MPSDPDDDLIDPKELREQFMRHAQAHPVRGYWRWHDRQVAERDAARIALRASGREPHRLWSIPDPNERPDCLAIVEDQLWGVEVTEFLDEETLRASIQAIDELPETADIAARASVVLHRVWDAASFLAQLQDMVTRKDVSPDRRSGGPFAWYVVVVVTSELYLDPDTVALFLEERRIEARHLDEVLFVLPMAPGDHGDHPVFRIVPHRA